MGFSEMVSILMMRKQSPVVRMYYLRLLRDKYYPNEKKPQLGKLLKQLIENKDKIILPADTLYNKESLLKMMVKFSEKWLK
ncbi:hypothetical protein H6795_02830 [Candidatus Nomurabacteria bacterium]|nr:hypothetical protein [Candidatus Nomurabacteria bacterium]